MLVSPTNGRKSMGAWGSYQPSMSWAKTRPQIPAQNFPICGTLIGSKVERSMALNGPDSIHNKYVWQMFHIVSWYVAFINNCVGLFMPRNIAVFKMIQAYPSSFFSKYIAALCSFDSKQGGQLWLPSSCQTNSANGHWRLHINFTKQK